MSKRAMQILQQRRAAKQQRNAEADAIELIGQLAAQIDAAQSLACAFAWDAQVGGVSYAQANFDVAMIKALKEQEERHGGK